MMARPGGVEGEGGRGGVNVQVYVGGWGTDGPNNMA
jgi:hypothetical protein